MIAPLLLLLVSEPPDQTLSINQVCLIHTKKLAEARGDRTRAITLVEEELKKISGQPPEQREHPWDPEVLLAWSSSVFAPVHERYTRFRVFVRKETGDYKWECTAMESMFDPVAVATTGKLPKETIRQVIKSHVGAIRSCYEHALQKNRALGGGALRSEFIIAPDGTVSSVTFNEDTVRSAEVQDCVAAEIKTWKFPQPEGNGKVIVKYPFIFRNAK